jgi:hypothetical protein
MEFRKRPERPAAGAAARDRRLRPRGPLERRGSPGLAQRAPRRARWGLRGLWDADRPGAGPEARVRLRRPLLALPPAPARPAGRRPRGPSLLGLYAQPLSDRQPSARRAQPSAHERREAQNRGRSRAHLAARALAVKARSGAPPPRSSTSRITGSRSGVGPSAQGAGPSSPPSAGSLQSYQIRKTRPHTCARGSSGVNWRVSPTPASSPGIGASSTCGGSSPRWRTGGGPQGASASMRRHAGLSSSAAR